MGKGLLRFLVLFLVFFLTSLVSLSARAADPLPATDREELFRQANFFFHEANRVLANDPAQAEDLYRKSLLRLERLVAEGVKNGRLYYNIGNVYYRLNDIGRAIVNYRRAERYLSDDPNLDRNLAAARAKRQDQIEEKQGEKVLKTLFFWHYDLSFGQRAFLFGTFYLGLWCLAVIRLVTPRPFTGWGLALSFLLAGLFLGSLLTDRFLAPEKTGGVLVASEVVARKGDGESYQPSFQEPLHAGTEFILRENRNQWLHIELPDGRLCWVPSWSAELIVPGSG